MNTFSTTAEEDVDKTLSLDDYLIENKEASYLLTMQGDSMVEAGIFDGDLVVVEKGRQPKLGNIIVAEVDGAFVMKYFHPEVFLKVEAVVRGVVRKY